MTPVSIQDCTLFAGLSEAAAWHFLALLFENPRSGWHEEVRSVARETGRKELRRLADQAQSAVGEEYSKVMGPKGTVSPIESTYQECVDTSTVRSELLDLYRSLSYPPPPELPADHIAVEIDFVASLLLREAFAEAECQAATLVRLRKARERFVENHLCSFAKSLARHLEGQSPGYLREAARVLLDKLPKN